MLLREQVLARNRRLCSFPLRVHFCGSLAERAFQLPGAAQTGPTSATSAPCPHQQVSILCQQITREHFNTSEAGQEPEYS